MYFITVSGEPCPKCKTKNSNEYGIDFKEAKLIQKCIVCGDSKIMSLFQKNNKWEIDRSETVAHGSVYLYNDKANSYEYMILKKPLIESQIEKLNLIFKNNLMNINKSSVMIWDNEKLELKNTMGIDINEDEEEVRMLEMNYYMTLDEWLDGIISNKDYDKSMVERYNKYMDEYKKIDDEGMKKSESLISLLNSIISTDAIEEIFQYLESAVNYESKITLETMFSNIFKIHESHGGDVKELETSLDKWLKENVVTVIKLDATKDDSLKWILKGLDKILDKKVENKELKSK